MQLSDPAAFVQPTFDQALADQAVAKFLLASAIADAPYNGSPALDAALAKLQQSAEKALKGAILVLAPGASSLVFAPHEMLSDKSALPRDPRFRAVLDRIARVCGGRPLRVTLQELEGCAPSGVRHAEIDSAGNIVSLPLNTEYPSMAHGLPPVAPVFAWQKRQDDVARFDKAVYTLFRHLKSIPQIAVHLADHPGKPISM